MQNVIDLLQGAYDLHVHVGPSVIPRSLDIVEALTEAAQYGMAGFVAKDHHLPTTMAAIVANTYHAPQGGCRAYSSIVLNRYIGGLNLEALRVATAQGARFVWLPTLSSENHDIQHQKHGLWFPASTIKQEKTPRKQYISLLDAEGHPSRELHEVLEFVADNPELVLCTGHGTVQEADVAIRLALQLGCRKIVATHPAYMIGADHALMRAWAQLGVFIDIGVGTCDPTLPNPLGTIEATAAIIHAVGSGHMILTSDLGQKINPRPMSGLINFVDQLLRYGIAERDIVNMLRKNPQTLLHG